MVTKKQEARQHKRQNRSIIHSKGLGIIKGGGGWGQSEQGGDFVNACYLGLFMANCYS